MTFIIINSKIIFQKWEELPIMQKTDYQHRINKLLSNKYTKKKIPTLQIHQVHLENHFFMRKIKVLMQ